MNGMWDLKMLQFPRIIENVQLITFIDGSTFNVYFKGRLILSASNSSQGKVSKSTSVIPSY